MKFYLVPSRTCLVTCLIVLTANAPVIAGSANTQNTFNYQSPFKNYKPLFEDNLSDWKSINAPSNGGGHAGHAMPGMRGMEKIVPKKMQKMEHNQMNHDSMVPMSNKDHSKMGDMDHDNMMSVPDAQAKTNNDKKGESHEH